MADEGDDGDEGTALFSFAAPWLLLLRKVEDDNTKIISRT